MARDFSLESFLKDLGLRFGAAAIVVGIFVGLGTLNRMEFLGLASGFDSQFDFFVTAFALVSLASILWIAVQRSRA